MAKPIGVYEDRLSAILTKPTFSTVGMLYMRIPLILLDFCRTREGEALTWCRDSYSKGEVGSL